MAVNSESMNQTNFISIRKIAELAGVSTATVSRVMNHPEQCKPETLEKVKAIIEEYNYVPNDNVRPLIGGTSNTLAIFVGSINNPYYSKLLAELNDQCLSQRFTLMICDTRNDIEKEKMYRDFCVAKRCHGIIVTEGISNTLFDDVTIPLMWLDRYDTPNASFVTSNNYESAVEVVRYLNNLGHRRIAFIKPAIELQSIENRFRGYKDGLAQSHLLFNEQYVYQHGKELNAELGARAIRHFLRIPSRPTAVFCANDQIALGVLNESRRLGIQVPEDLSVVGFDHVMDEYSFIKLTTVEQNVSAIVRTMVDTLINKSGRRTYTSVPTKFIGGETCTYLKTT